jgi:hypothetical protein
MIRKGVKEMYSEPMLEKIDALYDAGRDMAERSQLHGIAVESQFDECRFDRWRRRVNDLLYTVGGCDDIYYQRFSKEVVEPNVRSLEKGLRILAALRDDLAAPLRAKQAAGEKERGRPSVSYH